MRETGDVWKQLIAAKHTHVEYKFIIDGTEYTKQAEVEHEVHKTVFESFGIGNATIAQLNLTIYAGNVPRAAKIERMMRLVSGDEQISTDWEPAGVFFASRRAMDDDKWTVEAYDAMRKASVVWEPDQSLEFPMTMTDAVAEFCRILEVELDSRTVLNPDYVIDYPTDNYTIRNVLCFIGAANCGNWIITPEGKLYLVPLIPTGESHTVGLDLIRFEDNDVKQAVTRVTLYVDSAQIITAGYDHGVEIVADCPYATQAMVEAVLEKLRGFVYHPYEAGAARLDPAAELGDPVEVGGITSIIVSMADDGSGFPDISAPGGQELNDEYPEIGPMSQEINRKLAETRSQLTKTASEINAKVEDTDGRLAQLQIKVDGITLEVTSVSTSGGKTYARIRLKGGNGEWQEGQILLDGNVNVSGQLSAEALYARLGDIADLLVNRLSTSRRIPKYLARDTTDDRYFYVANEEQRMVRAWTDGSTEQARTPDGALLYWEQDISEATLGSNGYPFIDGVQVPTTTAETPYPVMVYVYQEGDRWKQTFAEDGNYGPRQIWGEGDGTSSGNGRGYQEKLGLSFDIYNKGTDGVKRGVFMGNDYTHITGLRKYKSITEDGDDIVVVLEGDITETFTRSYGSDGGLIGVTDQAGFYTAVTNPAMLPLVMVPRLLGIGVGTVSSKTKLEDYSWAEISFISKSGRAASTFALGDTKDIALTTGEVITMRIIGFDHDDLSDGAGKAGITLDMENMLETRHVWDSSNSTTLGWPDCEIRAKLQPGGEIYDALPASVQAVIRPVTKLTGNYVSSGWNSIDIDESSDYVFLLSEYEIAGTTTFSVGGEGEYYAYYKDYANTAALRHKVTKTGATDSFWTRSPRFSNTVCTFYLGNQNTNYASDKSARVSFGFCV